jgi:hypothetical protein
MPLAPRRSLSEKANLKRYVTTPANLHCNSNVVMTSTEISHVALQYYAQFKFCRCSIACEISYEIHFKQCKQYNPQHAPASQDVEAESKIRYKVLRAVKI